MPRQVQCGAGSARLSVAAERLPSEEAPVPGFLRHLVFARTERLNTLTAFAKRDKCAESARSGLPAPGRAEALIELLCSPKRKTAAMSRCSGSPQTFPKRTDCRAREGARGRGNRYS